MSWDDTNLSEEADIENEAPAPADADDDLAAEIIAVTTTEAVDIDEQLGAIRSHAGGQVADALETIRAHLDEHPSASGDVAFFQLLASLAERAGAS